MRILHLAYEDPAQPGSGGGSIRTREINRRLSERHEITALVAGYPGAKERVENGVRWIPIGPRTNVKLGRLAYFALLRHFIRTYPHDLLVEDFGAPFSVGFSPLFTHKPVIASVQWLFAAQMREKYHLPFDWIERSGLPLYRHCIVVSDWLARVVHARHPGTMIVTISNGIEDAAFTTAMEVPRHLLFVGRLDIEQKGCDILLASLAKARAILGDKLPPVLVAGDGPDRETLVQQAQQLGLADIVQFCGRVEGAEKYHLMAGAYAVLMPSRFETFGMVATESQAAGAPVIAFDVGPLAEVAGQGGARLVQPFDLDVFTSEIVACVCAPDSLMHLRHRGRAWAQRYNWDEIASLQEAVYLQVAADHPSTSVYAHI